jgi:hypothetical protein
MDRRTALVATGCTALVAPLLVLAPAGPAQAAGAPTVRQAVANNCFQTGTWRFRVQGGSPNTPGTLSIRVYGSGPTARHLRGTYRSYNWVTRGIIDGTLNTPCGTVWRGRFEDKSTPWNEGPFVATFDRATRTFRGSFDTHDGCNRFVNLIKQCRFSWSGWKV